MKYSSAQLKYQARSSLFGHYGVLIGAMLVYTLISMAMVYLPDMIFPNVRNAAVQFFLQTLLSFIIALILSVFHAGFSYMALNISRAKPTRFVDLFFCLRNSPDKIIQIQFVLTGIRFLLQLPGDYYLSHHLSNLNLTLTNPQDLSALLEVELVYILLTLGAQLITFLVTLPFTQAVFLAIDNEEMSAWEALRESRRLMSGNAGRYVGLTLSFIGLAFLSVLSFGIGYLWLVPYMMVTNAFFYRNVKGEEL